VDGHDWLTFRARQVSARHPKSPGPACRADFITWTGVPGGCLPCKTTLLLRNVCNKCHVASIHRVGPIHLMPRRFSSVLPDLFAEASAPGDAAPPARLHGIRPPAAYAPRQGGHARLVATREGGAGVHARATGRSGLSAVAHRGAVLGPGCARRPDPPRRARRAARPGDHRRGGLPPGPDLAARRVPRRRRVLRGLRLPHHDAPAARGRHPGTVSTSAGSGCAAHAGSSPRWSYAWA